MHRQQGRRAAGPTGQGKRRRRGGGGKPLAAAATATTSAPPPAAGIPTGGRERRRRAFVPPLGISWHKVSSRAIRFPSLLPLLRIISFSWRELGLAAHRRVVFDALCQRGREARGCYPAAARDCMSPVVTHHVGASPDLQCVWYGRPDQRTRRAEELAACSPVVCSSAAIGFASAVSVHEPSVSLC